MSLVPGDAAPTRKEYRITPTGEQTFLNWISKPVPAARDLRQDFLVKLFFWHDVDPAMMQALFHQQVSLCRKWLASLENQLIDSVGFTRQVLTFRIRQVQCILEWLQDLSHEKS
jgi:DNA-binding PadR family transcriptional regulator